MNDAETQQPEEPPEDTQPSENPEDGEGEPSDDAQEQEPQDPTITGAPAWGEAVLIGTVEGVAVRVQTPLNQEAVTAMDPAWMVAYIFHHRLNAISEVLQKLEGELSLHQRIAKLEGKLGDELGLHARLMALEQRFIKKGK